MNIFIESASLSIHLMFLSKYENPSIQCNQRIFPPHTNIANPQTLYYMPPDNYPNPVIQHCYQPQHETPRIFSHTLI